MNKYIRKKNVQNQELKKQQNEEEENIIQWEETDDGFLRTPIKNEIINLKKEGQKITTVDGIAKYVVVKMEIFILQFFDETKRIIHQNQIILSDIQKFKNILTNIEKQKEEELIQPEEQLQINNFLSIHEGIMIGKKDYPFFDDKKIYPETNIYGLKFPIFKAFRYLQNKQYKYQTNNAKTFLNLFDNQQRTINQISIEYEIFFQNTLDYLQALILDYYKQELLANLYIIQSKREQLIEGQSITIELFQNVKTRIVSWLQLLHRQYQDERLVRIINDPFQAPSEALKHIFKVTIYQKTSLKEWITGNLGNQKQIEQFFRNQIQRQISLQYTNSTSLQEWYRELKQLELFEDSQFHPSYNILEENFQIRLRNYRDQSQEPKLTFLIKSQMLDSGQELIPTNITKFQRLITEKVDKEKIYREETKPNKYYADRDKWEQKKTIQTQSNILKTDDLSNINLNDALSFFDKRHVIQLLEKDFKGSLVYFMYIKNNTVDPAYIKKGYSNIKGFQIKKVQELQKDHINIPQDILELIVQQDNLFNPESTIYHLIEIDNTIIKKIYKQIKTFSLTNQIRFYYICKQISVLLLNKIQDPFEFFNKYDITREPSIQKQFPFYLDSHLMSYMEFFITRIKLKTFTLNWLKRVITQIKLNVLESEDIRQFYYNVYDLLKDLYYLTKYKFENIGIFLKLLIDLVILESEELKQEFKYWFNGFTVQNFNLRRFIRYTFYDPEYEIELDRVCQKKEKKNRYDIQIYRHILQFEICPIKLPNKIINELFSLRRVFMYHDIRLQKSFQLSSTTIQEGLQLEEERETLEEKILTWFKKQRTQRFKNDQESFAAIQQFNNLIQEQQEQLQIQFYDIYELLKKNNNKDSALTEIGRRALLLQGIAQPQSSERIKAQIENIKNKRNKLVLSEEQEKQAKQLDQLIKQKDEEFNVMEIIQEDIQPKDKLKELTNQLIDDLQKIGNKPSINSFIVPIQIIIIQWFRQNIEEINKELQIQGIILSFQNFQLDEYIRQNYYLYSFMKKILNLVFDQILNGQINNDILNINEEKRSNQTYTIIRTLDMLIKKMFLRYPSIKNEIIKYSFLKNLQNHLLFAIDNRINTNKIELEQFQILIKQRDKTKIKTINIINDLGILQQQIINELPYLINILLKINIIQNQIQAQLIEKQTFFVSLDHQKQKTNLRQKLFQKLQQQVNTISFDQTKDIISNDQNIQKHIMSFNQIQNELLKHMNIQENQEIKDILFNQDYDQYSEGQQLMINDIKQQIDYNQNQGLNNEERFKLQEDLKGLMESTNLQQNFQNQQFDDILIQTEQQFYGELKQDEEILFILSKTTDDFRNWNRLHKLDFNEINRDKTYETLTDNDKWLLQNYQFSQYVLQQQQIVQILSNRYIDEFYVSDIQTYNCIEECQKDISAYFIYIINLANKIQNMLELYYDDFYNNIKENYVRNEQVYKSGDGILHPIKFFQSIFVKRFNCPITFSRIQRNNIFSLKRLHILQDQLSLNLSINLSSELLEVMSQQWSNILYLNENEEEITQSRSYCIEQLNFQQRINQEELQKSLIGTVQKQITKENISQIQRQIKETIFDNKLLHIQKNKIKKYSQKIKTMKRNQYNYEYYKKIQQLGQKAIGLVFNALVPERDLTEQQDNLIIQDNINKQSQQQLVNLNETEYKTFNTFIQQFDEINANENNLRTAEFQQLINNNENEINEEQKQNQLNQFDVNDIPNVNQFVIIPDNDHKITEEPQQSLIYTNNNLHNEFDQLNVPVLPSNVQQIQQQQVQQQNIENYPFLYQENIYKRFIEEQQEKELIFQNQLKEINQLKNEIQEEKKEQIQLIQNDQMKPEIIIEQFQNNEQIKNIIEEEVQIQEYQQPLIQNEIIQNNQIEQQQPIIFNLIDENYEKDLDTQFKEEQLKNDQYIKNITFQFKEQNEEYENKLISEINQKQQHNEQIFNEQIKNENDQFEEQKKRDDEEIMKAKVIEAERKKELALNFKKNTLLEQLKERRRYAEYQEQEEAEQRRLQIKENKEIEEKQKLEKQEAIAKNKLLARDKQIQKQIDEFNSIFVSPFVTEQNIFKIPQQLNQIRMNRNVIKSLIIELQQVLVQISPLTFNQWNNIKILELISILEIICQNFDFKYIENKERNIINEYQAIEPKQANRNIRVLSVLRKVWKNVVELEQTNKIPLLFWDDETLTQEQKQIIYDKVWAKDNISPNKYYFIKGIEEDQHYARIDDNLNKQNLEYWLDGYDLNYGEYLEYQKIFNYINGKKERNVNKEFLIQNLQSYIDKYDQIKKMNIDEITEDDINKEFLQNFPALQIENNFQMKQEMLIDILHDAIGFIPFLDIGYSQTYQLIKTNLKEILTNNPLMFSKIQNNIPLLKCSSQWKDIILLIMKELLQSNDFNPNNIVKNKLKQMKQMEDLMQHYMGEDTNPQRNQEVTSRSILQQIQLQEYMAQILDLSKTSYDNPIVLGQDNKFKTIDLFDKPFKNYKEQTKEQGSLYPKTSQFYTMVSDFTNYMAKQIMELPNIPVNTKLNMITKGFIDIQNIEIPRLDLLSIVYGKPRTFQEQIIITFNFIQNHRFSSLYQNDINNKGLNFILFDLDSFIVLDKERFIEQLKNIIQLNNQLLGFYKDLGQQQININLENSEIYKKLTFIENELTQNIFKENIKNKINEWQNLSNEILTENDYQEIKQIQEYNFQDLVYQDLEQKTGIESINQIKSLPQRRSIKFQFNQEFLNYLESIQIEKSLKETIDEQIEQIRIKLEQQIIINNIAFNPSSYWFSLAVEKNINIFDNTLIHQSLQKVLDNCQSKYNQKLIKDFTDIASMSSQEQAFNILRSKKNIIKYFLNVKKRANTIQIQQMNPISLELHELFEILQRVAERPFIYTNEWINQQIEDYFKLHPALFTEIQPSEFTKIDIYEKKMPEYNISEQLQIFQILNQNDRQEENENIFRRERSGLIQFLYSRERQTHPFIANENNNLSDQIEQTSQDILEILKNQKKILETIQQKFNLIEKTISFIEQLIQRISENINNLLTGLIYK